jgi:low temperature requirement protein LtrA
LELFFDLVAVAAVAQLVHLLRDTPGWLDVGVALVGYYAVWSVWTSFTLYGNVRAEQARVRFMVIGMVALGLLAVCLPDVAGARAQPFTIVYVIARIVAARVWGRFATIVTVWPAAQIGLGLVAWIVSLWIPGNGKYLWWALGAAIDITMSMLRGRRPQLMLDRLLLARRHRTPPRPHHDDAPLREATIDAAHLGERTGLFMIIVVAEAIVQVVDVTAEAAWGLPLWIAAGCGFAIALCLWKLTFSFGVLAVPHMSTHRLPSWLALPGHFAMTAAVMAIAAGTGALLADPGQEGPAAARWLVCAGIAMFFGTALIAGVVLRTGRGWLLAGALPATVAPVIVGLFAERLPGFVVLVAAVSITVWALAVATRPAGE